MTRRGFKEAEAVQVVDLICQVLGDINNEATIDRVRGEVSALCKRFPVYPK
jgi:glycine hydroxymethyltransferase